MRWARDAPCRTDLPGPPGLLPLAGLTLVAGCGEGVRPADDPGAIPLPDSAASAAQAADSAPPAPAAAEEEPDAVVVETASALRAALGELPWGATCEDWKGGAPGTPCTSR